MTGDVLPTQCVAYTQKPGELTTILGDGPTGQTVSREAVEITSSDTYWKSVGANASASMGIGGFGADASFKYFDKATMSRYGSYESLSTNVLNMTQRLKKPKLTPEASRQCGDPIKFSNMCGDAFVVGVQTGGQYQVIMDVSSTSNSEQQSASATLSAAGGTWKASASVSSDLGDLFTQKRAHINVIRVGADGPLNGDDLESFKAYAAAFPDHVNPSKGGKPWPVAAMTMSYRGLCPTGGASPQEAALEQIAYAYGRIMRRKAALLYWSAHRNQFGPLREDLIAVENTKVVALASLLRQRAAECVKDPGKCGDPSHLIIPDGPERAGPFNKLDSRHCPDVPVDVDVAPNGIVPHGVYVTAVYSGTWCPYWGGDPNFDSGACPGWFGPGQASHFMLHNLGTNQQQKVGSEKAVTVHDDVNDIQLLFGFDDDVCTDNKNYPDPAKAPRILVYGELPTMPPGQTF